MAAAMTLTVIFVYSVDDSFTLVTISDVTDVFDVIRDVIVASCRSLKLAFPTYNGSDVTVDVRVVLFRGFVYSANDSFALVTISDVTKVFDVIRDVIVASFRSLKLCHGVAFPVCSKSDVTVMLRVGVRVVLFWGVVVTVDTRLFVASLSVTGGWWLRIVCVPEDDVRFGEREYSVKNFEPSLVVVIGALLWVLV